MPSRRLVPGVLSLCLLSSILTGCSGGSSGGSGIGDQVTLPDSSPIPETPIQEEDDQPPATPGYYSQSRFWVQGESTQGRGLFAIPKDNNGSDEIDTSLLAELPLQTVPALVDSGARMAPRAIFYRNENGFARAPTDSANIQQISSQANAAETCLGGWAYDLETIDNTSVAYHTQRNGGDCPDRFSVSGWKQVKLSNTNSEDPQEFSLDFTPVAGLNNSGNSGEEVQWLGLEGGSPVRYPASNLDSREDVDTEDTAASFTELHLIGRIGTGAAIVAYTGSDASDADRNYQLAYYDRAANSISNLENSGGPELATLPRIPLADWVAPAADAVFFGIGNALVRADADGYRIIDSVDGPGRPYFVSRSDTHVIWGLLSQRNDSPQREIRVVGVAGTGARTLVRAPYVETRVRGTADGWFYFTAARGAEPNGEEVQPQALASASISKLFYRGGSSGMESLRALAEPGSPVAMEQGNPILPSIDLGVLNSWNSGAKGVFMGPGFGRQRLLTSVDAGSDESLAGETELRVRADRDLTNQVHWVDPDKAGSLKPIGNRGQLVRHAPLF